ALLPRLAERGGGDVVLLTYVDGTHPTPMPAHFALTQTALIGLAQALAKEYGGRDVRINAVQVGPLQDGVARELPVPLLDDFVRGDGIWLWDREQRAYRDFLSGYGTLPLGHNHPEVIEAASEVLRAGVPQFMQVSPQPLAAALAARLARLAPGGLDIAYFMSSGSEAVDGALKLARAATRRPRFVSAERAFHGITFGALSVTGHDKHRAPFEPLLPDAA